MIIDEIAQKYYDFYSRNGFRPTTLTVNHEQEQEIGRLALDQFNYLSKRTYREGRTRRVMGMFVKVKNVKEMLVR